jgi:hypothetical protein
MSFSFSPLKCVALLAAALVPAALTGCANMVTTATGTSSPAATVTGTLHGGQQPIGGATITLWAAGATGYGSASTLFATTTSAVDGSGDFAFSQIASSSAFPTGIINSAANVYSCPTTGNPQMYLIAKGGSTEGVGSPINSAAAFILPVGPCSTAGSVYVTVNEVTTVATLAALQQYFNPAIEGFGYNGTAQSALGYSNALGTINTLVNTSGGGVGANTTFTPVSTLAGATVTATPESAKINTIADILAACINTNGATTTGTACQTLFANAVPPASAAATSQPGTTANPTTFPTTVDTLQAAYYMLINPTDGGATALGNLFGLSNAMAPFQPTLTAAPTDWTIGISYFTTNTNAAIAGTPLILTKPADLAVDATGNIWVVNDSSTTSSAANSVTELSPTGGVEKQVLGNTLLGPTWITLDPSGNVYVPNDGASEAGTTVSEYTTGGATNTFTTGSGPGKTLSDGQGDIFVIEPKFGSGSGNLEEIPAGSTSGITATTIAPGLLTDFTNFAIDSNYNLWVTSGDATGATDDVYQFLYSTTAPHYPTTPSATTATAGGITAPENTLAFDNGNNLWIANFPGTGAAGTLSVSVIAATDTTTITGLTGSPFTSTTTSSGQILEFAIEDGASNYWFTNEIGSGKGTVYEVSDTGTYLTPPAGFVKAFNEPQGIAIDPSGNVWLANKNVTGSASSATSPQITEIVGAAVPVVTPLAAGLPTTPGGPSKLGAKP